ncbi:MAG: hypothetical protein CVV03_05410 [Firmicutes bacterium HGW-Firmicutes-8]|nr:MAG: hypothetical protein CVV03_05410 [Firmicutes bacterium HGW-Firmicutes-8]
MSPVQCFGCGLVAQDEIGGKRCLALKRIVGNNDRNQYWSCYYYLPVIVEDKPLTAFEHLLLKQAEIDRKK